MLSTKNIWKPIASAVLIGAVLWGCQKVPFTNRRQMKLLPESQLMSAATLNYQQYLSQNRLSGNQREVEMVKRVGARVQKAAESYYAKKGLTKQLAGYKWEFNLVEDATANAFCMPGGKVVVNTGLLPVTQSEDALAVVMGHEIAHALAHHGNERISQQAAISLGGEALNIALMNKVGNQQRNLFMQAYGAGAQLGLILPYSRAHESEADEIGLYLMAMAGYNPEAAAPLWERMGKMAGATPPPFLSTHPSSQSREQHLAGLVPKAKAYAQMYGISQ